MEETGLREKYHTHTERRFLYILLVYRQLVVLYDLRIQIIY